LVSGTIANLSAYSVFVNGVAAQPVGLSHTNWQAAGVPINPYGMASLSVLVYSNDPVLVASTNLFFSQPAKVVMESYSGWQMSEAAVPNGAVGYDEIDWAYESGGTLWDLIGNVSMISPLSTNDIAYLEYNGALGVDYWPFELAWQYANLRTYVPLGPLGAANYYFENHTQTRVMIEQGGRQPAGTTNAYLVMASAREFSDANLTNLNSVSLFYVDALNPGFDFITSNNGIYPDMPWGGDVGLPAAWLQINKQPLVNTGLIDYTRDSQGNVLSSPWGATIVSGPAGTPLDVTPVATNVYKNWQYTFNVMAYPIHMQILDANNNNQDLTLQTNTVIVGQQLSLKCNVVVSNSIFTNGFIITNFQWTVPGVAVTNYYVSADALQTNGYPVYLSQTNNQQVSFWWADGATNRTVYCSAIVDGATVTGCATFNVVRPVGQIPCQTGNVVLFGYLRNWNLGFLNAPSYNTAGILFSNIIIPPSGTNYNHGNTNYTTEWVQTISPPNPITITTSNNSGVVVHVLQTAGQTLDGVYPYPNADPGDKGIYTVDAPYVALWVTNTEVGASDTQYSKMWLMFKPTGGGWVPLSTVSWYWNGAAVGVGTNWSVSSSNWLANPLWSDAGATYPIWTNNDASTNAFNFTPPF
jgi:hypothetical protein